MTAAHASSILVDLGRDGLGIVTNRDLRTRVVAAGLPPDTPVSAIMTAPAETVPGEQPAADVLLAMLERNVHHFPVLGARGGVLGVVAAPDLLAMEARAPFHLRSAISAAADRDALAAAVGRLPDAIVALAGARTDPQVIGRIAATVHDAATARMIELAEAELGPAPVPYAWLMLGSVARREAFPSSDHDSALVHADSDDPAVAGWMERLATSVVDGLEACGIPRCANGAVASVRLFRRPLSQWLRMTSEWLERPDAGKALILVSVVVDGRRLSGSEALTDEISAVLADARRHELLLHRLGIFALSHRPPTGFFRDFVLTHEGERRGALDIKRGGLLPVVDLARWAAVTTGVTGVSTAVRLDAAEAGAVIDRTDVATLRDAFELFTQLRMDHQVAQLRAGDPPDDRLDPRTLSPLTRDHLKHAFRAVARVQRGIGYTGLAHA
jgi:CBS domain-containing protein